MFGSVVSSSSIFLKAILPFLTIELTKKMKKVHFFCFGRPTCLSDENRRIRNAKKIAFSYSTGIRNLLRMPRFVNRIIHELNVMLRSGAVFAPTPEAECSEYPFTLADYAMHYGTLPYLVYGR
jgi:hypothetical protein